MHPEVSSVLAWRTEIHCLNLFRAFFFKTRLNLDPWSSLHTGMCFDICGGYYDILEQAAIQKQVLMVRVPKMRRARFLEE